MTKKIKCKNCATEFIPAPGAAKPACPQCQTPAPMADDEPAIANARMTNLLRVIDAGTKKPGVFVIQYMPPGRQKVRPFVNNEAHPMEIVVTAKYAEVFDRANQVLIAEARAGKGDEPYTDFNHDDAQASSRPIRYYWGGDDPQSGGVLCETLATASGLEALTPPAGVAPDWTRFSPRWVFHKKTLEPLGLPVNQGGFVNRAAFTNISRLPVASAADAADVWALGDAGAQNPIRHFALAAASAAVSDNKPTPENNTMTDNEAAIAVAKAFENPAVLAALKGVVETATKPLADKITAFETKEGDRVVASAKAAVQRHVGRGAIPPQDTKAIEFWQNAYTANASQTEEILAKLPGSKAGAVIVNANGSTTTTAVASAEPEDVFIANAKAFGKNNNIADETQALIAYGRSAEGAELLTQFRQKVTNNSKS